MKQRYGAWLALLPVAGWIGSATVVSVAAGAEPQKAKAAKPGDPKKAVLAVVDAFEQAYKRKDKKAMLMTLMVPTNDVATVEKRYQWWRGYGPNDLAGSRHPPILFETSRGSFVPTSYKMTLIEPEPEGGRWKVRVREDGNYRDEDGRWKVSRVRFYRMTMYKGKWYVMDYYMEENPTDYGFAVDTISDKMTKL